MTEKTISEQVTDYTRELRLPGIRQHFVEASRQAHSQSLGYEDYLLDLLSREHQLRLENRRKTRLRRAGFPFKRYL